MHSQKLHPPNKELLKSGLRRCRCCLKILNINVFNRDKYCYGGRRYICHRCGKIERREYFKLYRKRHNETAIIRYKGYRKRALIAVGKGKLVCICCKESNVVFLTLDHIDQDGGGKKRELLGYKFYRSIWLGKYPKRLQILCYNCNCGRHANNGICPHVKGVL